MKPHLHPDVSRFQNEHEQLENHLDRVRRGLSEPDEKKARLAHSLAKEAREKADKLARFAARQSNDKHLREAVHDVNDLHDVAGALDESGDEIDHHLKGREIKKSAEIVTVLDRGVVVRYLDGRVLDRRPKIEMPDGWYIPQYRH